MARKTHDASSIYQLKVTLRGSKPPIWRRIQVRGNTTLPQLHDAIQTAMGWMGGHMHQFTISRDQINQRLAHPIPRFDARAW